MKTIYNYIIIVVLLLAITQISNGQNSITMNSTPAPGVYEATESITLQPGFSFTATQGNSLTLRIVPDNFTTRMNHIFQLVDKSRIATGLLTDYGLQIADPEYFNGVPADSNFVDMDTWRMLYSGMFTSRINSNVSLANPETVFTQIDNATHTTAVPVAMMHWQYNTLKEEALTLGLMQVVNGDQLQDVPNTALPYNTRQLFAAAPKKLLFSEQTVSFVFKSNLWHTNAGKTIQKREVSFDQGTSYNATGWDVPVSHTFGDGGVKTVYFRLTYTDNSSYTSQTRIYVKPPPAGIPNPGSTKSYNKYNIQEITISSSGNHSGGKIEYVLSSDNTTGKIRKPLIVAEGFDIGSLDSYYNMTLEDFLTRSSLSTAFGTIGIPYDNGYLSDKIDIAGYDIVYLDYEDGLDDIFRNAALFRQVIEIVNAQKQEIGSTEQNVVMGVSMGGLVACIALRQMEIDNQNHQTWKYISVDSPHKGANVPVGFQAAIRHIQNTNLEILSFNVLDYTNFDMAKLSVDLLNSQAAKQMLIYYLDQGYNFDNTVHNQFQTDYDNLGFPEDSENIAISNGSNNGTLNFTPGSTIINYQNAIWSFFPVGEVTMELQIKALSDQSASEIYHGHVYISKVLFIPVSIKVEEHTVNSVAGMLPLDGAPGGMYSLDMLGMDIPPMLSNSIVQPQFCFIPTVSSLALSDWNTKLTQNLSGITPDPFISVHKQNNNELHTRFNSSASFLYNHLISTPPLSCTISGPPTVCYDGSTFTLIPAPSGSVTWSVTGPFTVSGNGATATVTRMGMDNSSGKLTAFMNGVEIASRVVTPCPPPTITGPDIVYYSGASYELSTAPSGTITWTLPSSGAFSFSPTSFVSTTTGNTVSVYRVGSSSSDGQLTAKVNNVIIATISLVPCAAPTIEDYGASSTVYYTGSNFSLINNPGVTVYWTVSNASIFNVSPSSGNSTLVSRIGSGTGNVTLSARTGSASGPIFATKTLTPCSAPTLSGPGTVCGNGSYFSLIPNPGTTVYWTVSNTSIFTLSSSQGNSVTVYRVGTGTGSVTLSAHTGSTGGPVFATKTITPCVPSISGPSSACYGGATYTLNNAPSGTVSWASSDPGIIKVTSSYDNKVKVNRVGMGSGSITLSAYVNGTLVATLPGIQACSPQMEGPTYIPCNGGGTYYLPYDPNATYIWSLSGLIMDYCYKHEALVTAPSYPESGAISCTVIVNGQYSYYSKYVDVVDWSPVSAYPNPASGVLNIEIDANAVATQRSAVGLQSDPTYDIRLYDGLGNIVRQQRTKSSTVQFNVTNLQEGTYYLHIYDGVSNKPEMKQIIVQH